VEWQEICDNPLLRDPPFKVETSRWAHIEMEVARKKVLCFAPRAQEPWTCSTGSEMNFFDSHHETTCSALIPTFPGRIDIDLA